MNLFPNKHGIIPACDVPDLSTLHNVIDKTCSLKFIQAYKLGIEIVIPEGVNHTIEEIRKLTDLPIIYDHQKYGNDIPDVSGGNFLNKLKNAGVNALIIFPFAGVETLKRTVEACNTIGLLPIVGGEMTHKGFLKSEGGYLSENAPSQIYEDAAKLGVNTFVVPGTKIDKIKKYVKLVKDIQQSPTFLFPGIGKGQGGDIAEAFKASLPFNSSAIVGRGIYAAADIPNAASSLWETASSAL